MITNFKIYENVTYEQNNRDTNNFTRLLCIKEPEPHYFYKFTKGLFYKAYGNNRFKDDNGRFVNISHWNKNVDVDRIIFKYAESIFSTDNSIEEYELHTSANDYNM